MTMISKAAVGITVGIAGLFVGYCFYFDKKRRNDPDYKKNIRERRLAKKQAQEATSQIPNLNNPEAVQKFFVQEVQLGEELLADGDFKNGVKHLANAVAVCGQPQELVRVFQKTLPPEVFTLFLKKLPAITQRLVSQTEIADEDGE